MRHRRRLREFSDHELLVSITELLVHALVTDDHDLEAVYANQASKLLAEYRRRERRGQLQCVCEECMRYWADQAAALPDTD